MKDIVIRFGILAVALLALFQLGKYSLFGLGASREWLMAIFGLLFIGFGIFLSRFIRKPVVQETIPASPPTESFFPDEKNLEKFNISNRELEVLDHIAKGLSNQEIGEKLFISESTVKTHVSNILSKLDARRRTEAVKKAKDLGLLPGSF